MIFMDRGMRSARQADRFLCGMATNIANSPAAQLLSDHRIKEEQ